MPDNTIASRYHVRELVTPDTLEELKAKFPKADVSQCSNYQPPFLNHLPGEDDPGNLDEYFSREDGR